MPNFSGLWTVTQQMQAKGASTWPTPPGAPTIGTATAGGALCASVTFTAPACAGYPANVIGYRVISTPGCLSNTGASSPVVVSGLSIGTSYTFKVQATNTSGYGDLSTASNSVTGALITCSAYVTAGTYSFVVPAGVTSVSAVVVGAGGGGASSSGCPNQAFYGAPKRRGGAGGSLRWQNNIAVTPGETLEVVVGTGGPGGSSSGGTAGGQSYFIGTTGARFVRAPGGAGGTLGGSATSRTAAGTSAGTGTAGGGFGGGSRSGAGSLYLCNGPSGGGGAGGYQPCSGTAGCAEGASDAFVDGYAGAFGGGGGGAGRGNSCTAGGGGVGILGQGSSGAGGTSGSTNGKPGSGGTEPVGWTGPGGLYGGGGAGTIYNNCFRNGGTGGRGAVRIVWCKCGARGTPTFPSTNVGA